MYLQSILFFFSSRRRHTRYWRDWSSDVCSSDLELYALHGLLDDVGHGEEGALPVAEALVHDFVGGIEYAGHVAALSQRLVRSEERRVGKECRSRWSPYH